MKKIVLVRHGQSMWNLENRFTGWIDIDLSLKGIREAEMAGKKLKEAGFTFDLAYTSVLKRAIKTLNIILDKMDLDWIHIYKNYRLNERHYGGLQGLNKSETAKKHGDEQVHIWRRSFDIKPPENLNREIYKDARYKHIPADKLPNTESLKTTIERVLPFWKSIIVPEIEINNKIIIVAHGNSLRALIKHIENISDEEIVNLEIPTGRPIIYEFNEDLKFLDKYYL